MSFRHKNVNKHQIHHRIKHKARLAVVPFAANQFRPHLVRRHGLVAVLAIVMIAQLVSFQVAPRSVLGDQAPVSSSELLRLTNDKRRQAGEPALEQNEALTKAAFLKAQDMFAHNYWAHTAPDGTEPWKWFGDVNYNYSYAGENLAKNFSSAQAVISAWMDSAAHKENILKPQYSNVGFAVVNGTMDSKPTSLVVAFYAAPASSSVQGVGTVAAASVGSGGVLSQLGTAIQSMSPATLGSLVLLLFTIGVALVAHTYRRRLPLALRISWYRHHGALKAVGLSSVVFIIIALFENSGQI
jgi:uncharacterized protein YkwD